MFEAIVLIADPRVLQIPIVDNGEPLVDVSALPLIRLSERRAGLYPGFRLVRQSVADKLVAAAAALPSASMNSRLPMVIVIRSLRGDDAPAFTGMIARFDCGLRDLVHVRGCAGVFCVDQAAIFLLMPRCFSMWETRTSS